MRPNEVEKADSEKNIEAVRRRLQKWRQSKKNGDPIPDEIWESAAELVGEHGPYKISKALSLHYGKLMEWEEKGRRKKSSRRKRAEFIEIPPQGNMLLAPMMVPEVELIGADGSRLVVRLPGRSEGEIVSLASTLWRGRV